MRDLITGVVIAVAYVAVAAPVAVLVGRRLRRQEGADDDPDEEWRRVWRAVEGPL